MKLNRHESGFLGSVILISLSLAAGPAAKAPPASQPSNTDTSIAANQYHFAAPDEAEWTAIKPDPDAESITYINKAHDSEMALQLLPKDASVDPSVAKSVAVAIVKQLKKQNKDQNLEMVMQPKIEKDDRFAIVIHEKYKVGDQVADQLHVYKAVGPRVLMLTVNTTSGDASKIASVQKDAESLLDCVQFNRKAFKK